MGKLKFLGYSAFRGLDFKRSDFMNVFRDTEVTVVSLLVQVSSELESIVKFLIGGEPVRAAAESEDKVVALGK